MSKTNPTKPSKSALIDARQRGEEAAKRGLPALERTCPYGRREVKLRLSFWKAFHGVEKSSRPTIMDSDDAHRADIEDLKRQLLEARKRHLEDLMRLKELLTKSRIALIRPLLTVPLVDLISELEAELLRQPFEQKEEKR